MVRQARVFGVLDAAFDVLVPDFGIEKRVHVDQMPIDVRFVCSDAHALLTNPRITSMTTTRIPYKFIGRARMLSLGSQRKLTMNI